MATGNMCSSKSHYGVAFFNNWGIIELSTYDGNEVEYGKTTKEKKNMSETIV